LQARSVRLPTRGRSSHERRATYVTVNFLLLLAVPSGVTTWMTPVLAPAGTTAVIRELESTEKVTAATPPNLTDVAPSRLAPWMTTDVPTAPAAGEKLVIFGVPDATVTTVRPDAVTPLTAYWAVIVAFPTATALTRPAVVTVAMPLLLDDH
jgi:hypothetical protein